jgi:hypothetical protein
VGGFGPRTGGFVVAGIKGVAPVAFGVLPLVVKAAEPRASGMVAGAAGRRAPVTRPERRAWQPLRCQAR